ncbi:putative C-mannosyltransferase DPY19L1 isoform X2, partial [Apostichopus japonicus]
MAAKERKNGRHNRNKPTHSSSVGVSTDPLRPERTTQHGIGRHGSKIGNPSVLNMWNVSFVLFAVAFGVLQYYHVSTMFEYDRFFSHLSDLEREMTFRSEMMFLGILKRGYESFMNSINQPTRMCYNVRRGRGLSDVQSCEGMGDIAIFYVNSIFFWNGCMMSAFFSLAVLFSGSLFGGFIAVAAFFYNHGECTRVQWTPPLRESMGYPFFILQLLAITYTLSIPRPRWLHSAFIFISSLFFMLCWQFAQFTLLTQMLSIFATFMLGYIRLSTLRCVLQGQSVALVTAYILLFGNELLLTSYYPACLITLWVIVCLEPVFQVHSSRIALWILQSVILVAGTASFKFLISSLLHVADDAHIGNLLMSKISDYKDFHTLLYICSKEFDFIETETIFRFLYSLLLPSALAALLMVMYN